MRPSLSLVIFTTDASRGAVAFDGVPRGGSVKRSEAATTLFRWQFEAGGEPVRATPDDRPLVSIVESLAGQRRARPRRRAGALPPPPVGFLPLGGGEAVEELRARAD